jgi:tetratricopeptide (TPR) repeat protein
MDTEQQVLLKHLNRSLSDFLSDFFRIHKHLLTEEKTKKALVKYWQNVGIPNSLVDLISSYTIYIGLNLLYLGKAYSDLGDLTKAKDILGQSLAIYKKHYGEDHIQTAKVSNALGENYLLEGKLETAEISLNRALDIFQKTSHPEIYTVFENLSTLYTKKAAQAKDAGNSEQSQHFKVQAIDYLKQAAEVIKTRFPQPSPHNTRIQSKLKELLIKDL